jgi:hypothetical protein
MTTNDERGDFRADRLFFRTDRMGEGDEPAKVEPIFLEYRGRHGSRPSR